MQIYLTPYAYQCGHAYFRGRAQRGLFPLGPRPHRSQARFTPFFFSFLSFSVRISGRVIARSAAEASEMRQDAVLYEERRCRADSPASSTSRKRIFAYGPISAGSFIS